MMKIRLLATPWQRAIGAMFRRSLGETVLIFVYPYPAARSFHTYFCPPLRILALDDDGKVIHDQVEIQGRFVNLPKTTFVVEADPTQELPMETLAQMARSEIFRHKMSRGSRHSGSWDPDASLDRLLFILLATAVADLRRLKECFPGSISQDQLCQQFDVHERSQIVGSAAFLQGYTGRYRIPSGAIRLSEHLLAVEKPHLAELYAASVAGMSWDTEIPGTCARCGKACTWRPAIDTPVTCKPECTWRYGRPENAVPLCHKCIGILDWLEQPELRQELAAILWQKRFAAFQRWHTASIQGSLPAKWDRLEYPLWPAAYGGKTWEDGSGHIEHANPRPPLEANLDALKDYIAQVFPIGRGRKKISKTNMLPKKQLASKRGSL